jgi:hypothetical protein
MLIMQTSESEAHETYLFVENDDQPIPKHETYPEANEEVLHWLLHPIAKIRNAYTAY